MAGPTAPPPGGGRSYHRQQPQPPPPQQQQQEWDRQEGFPLPPETPLKETVQRYVLVVASAGDVFWKDRCNSPFPHCIAPLSRSFPEASRVRILLPSSLFFPLLDSVSVHRAGTWTCVSSPRPPSLPSASTHNNPPVRPPALLPSLPPSRAYSPSPFPSFLPFPPLFRIPSSPPGDVPCAEGRLERRLRHPSG